LAFAAVAALVVGFGGGSAPTAADVSEASVLYQGWYFRAKPESPVIQTPQGPVSAGPEFPPAPQAVEGGYTVAFAGGTPGEENGDTGWAAFQWDLSPAQGGSVDEFIVTFTKDPGNRGDFGTPLLRACNIVTAWAAPPTANPWALKPAPDCATGVPPSAATGGTFTFDLTAMAKEWLDNRGFGVMIMPGPDPAGAPPPYAPFQLTLAGYNQPPEELNLVPKVTFRYTTGAGGLGAIGGDIPVEDSLSVGVDSGGGLAPAPAIDVIPTDVGSTPDPGTAAAPAPPSDVALPSAGGTGRARPAANTDSGTPVVLWLLLPLALIAFWGTGTALGPAGDPTLPRQGGVSRVLGLRRAAASTTSTEA
jgi:hypothetical protein